MRAVKLDLANLQQRHAEYMAKVKASGGRILTYKPPCGCPEIETPAPPDGHVWDSLSTCLHCGDHHMKVVRHNRASASRADTRVVLI